MQRSGSLTQTQVRANWFRWSWKTRNYQDTGLTWTGNCCPQSSKIKRMVFKKAPVLISTPSSLTWSLQLTEWTWRKHFNQRYIYIWVQVRYSSPRTFYQSLIMVMAASLFSIFVINCTASGTDALHKVDGTMSK